MEALRTYILSVIATGILCAVIGSLGGKGSHGSILKLMCGIVLTAVILRPILSLPPVDLSRYLHLLDTDAAAAVDAGLLKSKAAARDRISQELEAYILDKAGELGLQITVSLMLDEQDPVPASVTITGDASPHARSVMSGILRDDLGIPTELLVWN